MNGRLIKKTLWIIFGITAFIAIDSLIYSITYYIFHHFLDNSYAFSTKTEGYIFIIILCLYLTATAVIAYSITKRTRSKDYIIKENIPIITFLITLIIAIFFKDLTNSASDKKLEVMFNNISKMEYMSSLNLSSVNTFLLDSMHVGKWLAIICLVIYLFILSRYSKTKL